MLREKADLQLGRAHNVAAHRLQAPRQQLRECRLAVAIGAEQADAVVVREREIEPRQHDAFVIADRPALHGDDRRRELLFGRGQVDRQHVRIHDRRRRLHLFQHLEARLRLPRLRRLGAKAVDEFLQVLALVFLLLGGLGLHGHQLAPLLFEAGIIALPERQLRAVEMQDVIADGVQQIAIVRDDDGGSRIGLEMFDQPERTLEVEVVGGLVEQQQVGLGEQHGG